MAGVTYWTGIWDPEREGISGEAEFLRRSLSPGSPVVSISAGQRFDLQARKRVLRLGPRHYHLLRLAALALEPFGRVSHVFGGVDDWHLLRSVGRRPVLFTVVAPGTSPQRELLRKVALFAVESDALAGDLRGLGIEPARIRVVYPGVDLERFAPAGSRTGRFRVLFASSPSRVSEFDARGIPQLVELARAQPEIDVLVRWRDWGDMGAARAALDALRPPSNFVVDSSRVADMTSVFHAVDAVVLLFADGFGKSAPNSVIEGLACGRPALVTSAVGIAGLIASSGAGLVESRDARALAAAVDRLRAEWPRFSRAARELAVRHFDARHFQRTYAALYSELAGNA